jgi:hypothetical protein
MELEMKKKNFFLKTFFFFFFFLVGWQIVKKMPFVGKTPQWVLYKHIDSHSMLNTYWNNWKPGKNGCFSKTADRKERQILKYLPQPHNPPNLGPEVLNMLHCFRRTGKTTFQWLITLETTLETN